MVETKNSVAKLPFHTRLIRQIAEKSKRAVVSIYAKTKTPYCIRLIPKIGNCVRVRVPGAGLGSGFFIHPSGNLLTNDHVIHPAEEIMVPTRNGASYNVVSMARDPVFDLALLKIQGSNKVNWRIPIVMLKKRIILWKNFLKSLSAISSLFCWE